MKVIMINGSPHKDGTTVRALKEISEKLKDNGIETEIIHIGALNIRGCIACGACAKLGKCVFNDDPVNETVEKIKNADGLIVGSPVYYASISGTLKSFLDRLFYSSAGALCGKPAAAVTVARRAGTTATLDIINKYFAISSMPIITSQYWNMVHGLNKEQAEQDIEGLQTMRILAKNFAWILKCIEMGKQQGITFPEKEKKIPTNFIR